MARVLLVEDEAVLRLTFSEFLREAGHTVHAAEDYAGAEAILTREDVDVVITDIILGGRTGVDLLRTVRERGLDCPVVMITGEPNVETASEAVRLGAFDYLAKPVTEEALLRVTRLAADRVRILSERNHYARELDRYRRDLEAIFNSVTEGIVTVDAEMRVRQVNAVAEGILAVDAASAAHRPFGEVFGEALEPAADALRRTLDQRGPQPERTLELAAGDAERVLSVHTAPLLYQGDAFGGALLMLRDITRITRLERQVEDRQRYRDLIGKSARMQDLFGLIRELAETDSTVLIYGESGTGKELVASAIHHASGRADGPFLKVNCAALSESILESELFGHVKGAFTGAHRDRVGRFEAADGGTILLDEIGDISPRLQLRLLRVLQEREFERVGSSTPVRSDVRVIASTNQRLEQKIQRGEFRQDLYYRLNVVRIDIPPLRDRREDIPLLVDEFHERFRRTIKGTVRAVSGEAMEAFMAYDWPGNVRELENCIERAFIVCREGVIEPRHLPPEVLERDEPPHGLSAAPEHDEATRILDVLQQTDWNVAKSARMLGIARNTLYQRMRALNLQRPVE